MILWPANPLLLTGRRNTFEALAEWIFTPCAAGPAPVIFPHPIRLRIIAGPFASASSVEEIVAGWPWGTGGVNISVLAVSSSNAFKLQDTPKPARCFVSVGIPDPFRPASLGQSPEKKAVDGNRSFCEKEPAHEIGSTNMKTKALLVAGLMMAASAASSLAQTVYSVNAVGFVNVTFPPGFTIASNPLVGATNTVAALFSNLPFLSQVFKFDPQSGNFTSSTYLGGTTWTTPGMTLVPGEAFFFKNPSGTAITNTFVGNVSQGTLVTPLPAGFSMASSQVPQAGLVATDLQLPANFLDAVYTFDSVTGYTGYTYLGGTTWVPSEPTIGVGQGFFVKKQAAASWTRNFNVNQ